MSITTILMVLFVAVEAPNWRQPDYAAGLGKIFYESMIQCPDRIWQGHDWNAFQILLIDKEQRLAFLWNDQSKEGKERFALSPVPFESLGDLLKVRFAYLNFKGTRTMAWVLRPNIESGEQATYIIHEAFHETSRKFLPQEGMRRGINYAEKWRPRYYRQEIINALRIALKKNQTSHLRAASYWYQKLKAEFPDALAETRVIDRDEGTAEYAAVWGHSLAIGGCKASDRKLFAIANKEWQTWRTQGLDKEGESYKIGALAAVLLQERAVRKWQTDMTNGGDLLELLLTGVQPTAQPEDTHLADEVKKFYEEKNAELAGIVEPTIQELTSPEFYILAIPLSWEEGSYNVAEFVNFKIQGIDLAMTVNRTSIFKSPLNGGHGQLKGQNTPLAKTPCSSDDRILVPFLKNQLNTEITGYSVNTSTFEAADLHLRFLPATGGMTLLCAE